MTLYATTPEDLSRDVLKSDSAMVTIPELDLELQHGTLGVCAGLFCILVCLTKKERHVRCFQEGNIPPSKDF